MTNFVERLPYAIPCLFVFLLGASCSQRSTVTRPEGPAATDASEIEVGPDADMDAGMVDAPAASPEASVGVARPGLEAGALACTITRPQLTPAQAATDTILAYFAEAGIIDNGLVADNWDPTAGLGDPSTFTPTFTVSAMGGTHTTIQAAVNDAVTRAQDAGKSRVYILVSPGTYNEVVCVPANAPPITLYSANADPTQTIITYNNYNGEAKAVGAAANPCTPNASALTFGTAGSATFSAFAPGFQAKNMTFANSTTIATLGATTGTQAVALMTEADQVVLENVHVVGHQDALYMETPGAGEIVRVYVKGSFISGDVDFIFGGASAVLDTCEIQFVSDRTAKGQILSPSTDARNPYGMLVTNSNLTADSTTKPGVVGLGRAWDRSCTDIPTYLSACVATGDYPNGQAVVRDSMLGAQIAASPWFAAATTKRPYCDAPSACIGGDAAAGICPANRLYEFDNTGPGSAPH